MSAQLTSTNPNIIRE